MRRAAPRVEGGWLPFAAERTFRTVRSVRPVRPSVRKELTVKKMLDSWAGIGIVAVVLAALGALWASTTV